jgi:hypothetical protein
LSGYAYLNGKFNFNKTPLSPPGTKVVVHLKPDQQASWAYEYHGKEDRPWSITAVSNATSHSHTENETFPKVIAFPAATTKKYLKQAVSDILAILQKPPTSLPYLAYGDNTKNALIHIATLLGRAKSIPTLPTADPPRMPPPDPPRAPALC